MREVQISRMAFEEIRDKVGASRDSVGIGLPGILLVCEEIEREIRAAEVVATQVVAYVEGD